MDGLTASQLGNMVFLSGRFGFLNHSRNKREENNQAAKPGEENYLRLLEHPKNLKHFAVIQASYRYDAFLSLD